MPGGWFDSNVIPIAQPGNTKENVGYAKQIKNKQTKTPERWGQKAGSVPGHGRHDYM